MSKLRSANVLSKQQWEHICNLALKDAIESMPTLVITSEVRKRSKPHFKLVLKDIK